MLRPRNRQTTLLIAVLLLAGSAFAQHKSSAEVTVTKCWQFPVENVVALTTNGQDVFAAAEGGRVFAWSSKGEKLWQTDLGGEILPQMNVGRGSITVTSRGASGALVVRQLSMATGVPMGVNDGDPGASQSTTASTGDPVVLGSDSGVVASLSASGPIWRFKTGGAITAVIPVGDEFVVISRDNFVYSLNAKNGGLQWKRRMQGRIAHYGLGKGYLLVSSMDQHGASLIDLTSGRLAGQIVLDGDDQFVLDPVVIGESFVTATDHAIAGYSLTGCGTK
ncbi:MAG: PQQ-binding-like beta-propeller repeat protein [Acidobacteria bacterium]|nr:PQQ-binding-like beta-propeller repeat protein [Acidobacteriota bacterium]